MPNLTKLAGMAGLALTIAVSGARHSAASDVAMVADGVTASAVVFDPDDGSVIAAVPAPTSGSTLGDCAITSDRTTGFFTDFQYGIGVVDLTGAPALAPAPNPIPLSNPGEDVDLTPDERFLVVCDGLVAAPVSVVDVTTRMEVSTLDLPLGSCVSVDVCDDGMSILVASVGNTAEVRRLTIDAAGVLTDSGESLALARLPFNVHCAPGSRSGVVTGDLASLVSFAVPTLQKASDLGEDSSDFATSLETSESGDRLYVRRRQSIAAFVFDPSTGVVGDPLYSAPTDLSVIRFGMDTLVRRPGTDRLYVSNSSQSPGGPSIGIHDAATGALVDQITDVAIAGPTGICFPSGAGSADQDGDGIPDDLDDCPSVAAAPETDADGDGCPDVAADLCSLVLDQSLPQGIAKSLCAKADAAAKKSPPASRNSLAAFVNEVEAQSGKKIPGDTAALLVEFAENAGAQP